MADLITLVTIGIFGVMTVLFVMFFILLKQSGKPRFENQDNYKSYELNDGYANRGNPFKQVPSNQDRREQQTIRNVIIPLVVTAILVAIFFDIFAGLLIIFSLPIVVRFIRMRNEPNSNRNKARNENRSSY